MVDVIAPLPFQEIFTYGGMIIGSAVAAFLGVKAWKKAATPSTELAITGQAQITDMLPVREIAKNIDLLTMQMQKAAVQDERRTIALERLANVLSLYLEEQGERQERADIETEVNRRVAEKLKSSGMEPATQPIRRQPKET